MNKRQRKKAAKLILQELNEEVLHGKVETVPWNDKTKMNTDKLHFVYVKDTVTGKIKSEQYTGDPEAVVFVWTEGSMSCQCNLATVFGMKADQCIGTRFKVWKINTGETGDIMIYACEEYLHELGIYGK